MQNLFDQFDNPPHPLGPQPQPWPGAVTGPTIESPRLRTLEQGDVRVGIDQEQNSRAWRDLQIREENLARDREKWDRERRTSEGNSGVESTASQDQAAGHVAMLRNNLATLQAVRNKTPEALKPTLKEFGVRWLLTEDPEALGALQNDERQQAFTAYQGVVDSAIWLMTGAAAPEHQDKRIRNNITPGAFDKPGNMAVKHRNLLAYIEQARARAGAGEMKLDGKTPYTPADMEALDYLEQQAGLLYGSSPIEAEQEKKQLAPGQDTKNIPIPPAMQAEHDQFMKAAEPGKLSVGQYVGYYNDLTKRYGIEGNVDLQRAQDYVDAFNSGRPTTGTLPPPEVEQGAWEKISGGAAASELGTGVKNFASAMTMGVPELLAGREGREASGIADEINPKMAITGEILGSVIPGIGLERLGAKAAEKWLTRNIDQLPAEVIEQLTKKAVNSRAARLGADMGANAVYGGITEFNQTGDTDAALANAAMGAGGAGITRGVTKGFAEFRPQEFRKGLDDLGPQDIFGDDVYDQAGNLVQKGEKIGTIPAADLTTFQRMGFPRVDQFLEGFPGIAGIREDAVKSMNLHDAARALGKAGLQLPKGISPGHEANAYVRKALQDEYEKLGPSIKGKIDGPYTNAIAGLRATTLAAPKGKTVDPKVKEMWQHLEDANQAFIQNKKFDYDSYKKFTGELREWEDAWRKTTVGPDGAPSVLVNRMAPVAQEMRKQARALVSRANPTAGARLKRLDNAWAHRSRLAEASKGAAKQESGVASPQEKLNAIEKLDKSKDKVAISEGKGYDQPYSQSAMRVMGQKPSKGGSPLATGAIGFGAGTAIIPVTMMAYTPVLRKFTQAITDGRYGKALDKLTPERVKKDFPELPTDIINKMIATAIRERTVGN